MGCVYCGGQPGNHLESCRGNHPTMFEQLMVKNQKLKQRLDRLEEEVKRKNNIEEDQIDDLSHLANMLFANVLTLNLPDRDKHYINKQHLIWMCYQIASGEVTGPKAHRWIGYIQGVLVCRGNYTLNEMKELNKEFINN